jgi:hypothetical protein
MQRVQSKHRPLNAQGVDQLADHLDLTAFVIL